MGYRRIVLGTWECGAFGTDLTMEAETFRRALVDDGWRGAFDDIHLAVLDYQDDPDDRRTSIAFDRALAGLDVERRP